jgi:hypothetical protein
LIRVRAVKWLSSKCWLVSGACIALAILQASADSPKTVIRRTSVQITASHAKQDKEWREELLEFGKDVDRLAAIADEWGTIQMSSFLFAPTSFQEGQTRKPPFKLESGTPDGQEALGLERFYTDYNTPEGESLFSERVLTRTFGAAGINQDAVAKLQFDTELANYQRSLSLFQGAQETQYNVAQQNVSRALEGTRLQDEAARRRVGTAEQRATAARTSFTAAATEVATAQADLKDATAAVNAKEREIKELELIEKPTDAEKQQLRQAKLDKILLDQNKASTEAILAAATAKRDLAAEEKKAADKELDDSRTALRTQLGGSILDPDTLPGTLVTPPDDQKNLKFPASGKPEDPLADLPDLQTKLGFDPTKTIGAERAPTLARTPEGQPTVGGFNPRLRVIEAAGTAMVKNIFSFLGDPQAAEQYKDKRLLFGVSTVSVNPGWRTKRDFTAHLDVHPTLSYVAAHAETIRQMVRSPAYSLYVRKKIADSYSHLLSDDERAFFNAQTALKTEGAGVIRTSFDKSEGPKGDLLAASISPLMDTQALDLASSFARQDEVALYLAATLAKAGFAGSGSAFHQWVRQRRRDVATRSTVPVANSYSMAGGIFGMEIGPRLRGLANPEARKSAAAMTFERQSFPILILFGAADSTMRPVIEKMDDARVRVWEPRLTLRYSTRWSRTEHKLLTFLQKKRPPSATYELDARISDRFDALGAYMAAYPDSGLTDSERENRGRLITAMQKDYEVYQRSLFGCTMDLALPAAFLVPEAPGAETAEGKLLPDPNSHTVQREKLAISPASLALVNQPEEKHRVAARATVLVKGENLDQVDLSGIGVESGPAEVVARPAETLGDKAFEVALRFTASDGDVVLRLPLKTAGGAKVVSRAKVQAGPVFVGPLRFAIYGTRQPEFTALPRAAFRVINEGTEAEPKATFEILLPGANLNLLDETSGRAIDDNALPVEGVHVVSMQVHSPGSAIAVVNVQKKKEGSFHLRFSSKLGSGGGVADSQKITFTVVQPKN